MRTVFILLIFSGALHAQDSITTGCIQYERIVRFSEQSMRYRTADAATEDKQNWSLCFTPEKSYYTFQPEPIDEDDEMARWYRMFFLGQEEDIVYLDFAKKKYTHYKVYLTKAFLIRDTLSMNGWKMTGKQGLVQGYPCLEALKVVDDSVKVLAWFTPRIPVQTGPDRYCGLPGAVLYVNIDDGKTTISAVNINMGATREVEPEIPTGGEVVSLDEFDAIVRERSR